MAKYLQITPAPDWFYAFNRGTDSLTVFYVAAWALTDAGTVIGLVGSVKGSGRLVEAPDVRDGIFLHRDELNDDELRAARKP